MSTMEDCNLPRIGEANDAITAFIFVSFAPGVWHRAIEGVQGSNDAPALHQLFFNMHLTRPFGREAYKATLQCNCHGILAIRTKIQNNVMHTFLQIHQTGREVCRQEEPPGLPRLCPKAQRCA